MKLERNNLIILVLAAWVTFSSGNVFAQADHKRSFLRGNGTPAPMRVESDPVGVPCTGVSIFEEDFEAGLPAGWLVVDGDGLTPRSETGLAPGWQVITDYRDTSNMVIVSPSWYDNGGGVSNDWLISPSITLGDNPCFSWTAYSQDGGYLEGYEVYLSTTGTDTADFLAGTRIDTVPFELDDYTIRALSLLDFANQTVNLAFRQISDDKFVLALDNIKISNIVPIDIGAYAVAYGNPSPGDTLEFDISVANYGSETVTSFELCYSIDGGTASCMLVDSLVLEPNQILPFTHDDLFISDTLDEFYSFCAWTKLPNNGGDNEVTNDTLCEEIPVGNPVGISSGNLSQLQLLAFPNPAIDVLHLDLKGNREAVKIQMIGMDGKVYLRESHRAGQSEISLNLAGLPKGVYLLRAETKEGKVGTSRVILQ